MNIKEGSGGGKTSTLKIRIDVFKSWLKTVFYIKVSLSILIRNSFVISFDFI